MNSGGVAIVCALPIERAAILAGLGGGGSVQVVASGIGPDAALRAARQLCSSSPRPELVISAGFCGALDESLKVGDTVLCDEILDADTAATLSHPRAMERAPVVQNRLAEAGISCRRGVMLGSRVALFQSSQKRALGQRFRALAVDMESAALARELHAQRIPVLVVRTVSDSAEEDLPPQVAEFLTPAGKPRMLRILRFLLGGPSRFRTLMRLKAHSETAAKALTAVFAALRGEIGS